MINPDYVSGVAGAATSVLEKEYKYFLLLFINNNELLFYQRKCSCNWTHDSVQEDNVMYVL